MIEQQPSWLHIDSFVDIKGKEDGWKVGYVLDSTKNQVRIRMDGWSNKLDELHFFTSNKLRPFRTVVRGYTGQKKYPAIRDHWKFSIEQHMNKLQKFSIFQANLFQYQPEQITQYLRGHHYFYMDFLMTRKYTTLNEIQEVYNYFKKHIDFTLNYLQQFSQTEVPTWFAKNTQKPQFQAYAEGYFQYFDTIHLIMGCEPRSTSYWQENKQLLNELKGQCNRIVDYLGLYFTQVKFLQTLKQALVHIQKYKQYQLPVPFLRGLLVLFFGLDKIATQKELKKAIYNDLLQILKNQIAKLKPAIVKNDQYDLENIFSLLKRIFFMYKEKNQTEQQWLAISKLNVASMMILTDSLEKRLKGISKIKQLYQALLIPNEYQLYQLPKQKFKSWLFNQQLLQIIFEHNQHFQVVKKGCELIKMLYPTIIGCKQLINIWNACKTKHEAVRTNIQSLWLDMCLLIQGDDLQDFVRVVVDLQRNFEWQIHFIFHFCEKIVKRRQNLPIIEKLLDICYEQVLKNEGKINVLSQIIFKCNKEKITKKSVQKCLLKIQAREKSILHMRLLQEIISEYYGQKIYLPEETLSIMIKEIKNILTSSGDQIQENLHFIFKLLNQIMLANQRQATLCEEQFMDLWEMFSNIQNINIKRTFYNWILQASDDGILHLRSYRINSNFDQDLRVFIFRSILIDHKKLDYINISEQQFIIFREFMIEVNRLTGKLQAVNHISGKKLTKINELEIEGNKQLWNIFLNCKNENVFELVSEFLKQLHLNFGSKMPNNLKVSKLDELMAKLCKNIKDGVKKNNIRLIRHSLKLLGKIILQLKQQKFQTPKQFQQYLHINSQKILLTVYKQTEKNVYKLQIPFSSPLYEVKAMIAKHLGVEHDSFNFIVNGEQVSKDLYVLPYFALSAHKNVLYITFQENAMKKFVLSFVRQNLYDFLIQLLGNESASPDAFTILEELPFSEKDAKFLETNTQKKDNLGQKSIYYNFYLLKVMSSFQNYSLQSKIQLLSRILQQFHIEVSSPFSVTFCLHLIDNLNKIMKQVNSPIIKSEKVLLRVYDVMVSFLHYSIKREKNTNEKEFRLFKQLFISMELCLDPESYCMQKPKKSNLVLKFLLKQERYKRILHALFIQYKFDILKILTCKKFSEYFDNGVLLPEQQQLLLNFMIIELYPSVVIDYEHARTYPMFFKIFKIILDGCSNEIVDKLALSQQNGQSFYQNILLSAQKTNYQTDNDVNAFLHGYLLLLSAFLSKFPQLITQSLLNFILYKCLFFEEKDTESTQIKCKHSQSITNCLNILNIICAQNAEYCERIYDTLMKYQTELSYWRTSQKWSVEIEEQKKSKTGFVGMDNPGCICYLNSFMQQLFMIPAFRSKILELACDPNQETFELLTALKLLFLKLQFTNQQSISPLFFSKTIKTANQKPMIRVYEQMDIDEYCAILLDKIENLLPKNNNFVRKLFGGIYANEIISKECKHTSQRQEMFLSVMLDVKKSILESLQTLVQGQTLEGQNAYFCQSCDKKVKAVKRVCLKRLPQTLMISLRRIQFNYQIDAKIKINDYCQFPIQLDLTPYSYEKLHQTVENADQQQMKQEKQEIRNQPSYYHYKLKGVVVHTGYADSGHYYSFIQDRNDGKWYEFNDSKVSEFDVSKLSQQTFGGSGKDSEGNKIRNAYILIYERQRSTQQMEIQTVQSSHNSPSLQVSQAYNQEIINSIIAQNHIIQKYCVLFSKPYYQFLSSLKMFKGNQQKLQQSHMKTLLIKKKLVQVAFFFIVKIRERDIYQTLDYAEHIQKIIFQEPSIYLDLLVQFLNPNIINQLFTYCAKTEKARITAEIIVKLVKKTLQNQTNDGQLCPQIKSLLLVLVKTLVEFSINNSKICYILRKLAEQNQKILQFLYSLKIHEIILTNLSASMTKQLKIEKLKALNSEMDQISIKQSHIFGKHSEEKCTVNFKKNQKQAIHILNLIIGLKIPYINPLQQLKTLILSLSLQKISYIIDACSDTKSIIALSTLLKQLITQEWRVFNQIIKQIQKALKDFESSKYRPYLLILFEILQLNDHLKAQRTQKIANVIREALKANQKFYMQIDIILQWVLKMCSISKEFLKNISEQKYLLEIMKYLNTHKAPTSQILKKHKNPHCERLLQRMHGVYVYTQLSDYEQHNRFKISKFSQIYHKQFKPIPCFSEPDLKQQYEAGSDIHYWLQSRWFYGRVLKNQYGMLKLQFVSQNQPHTAYTQYMSQDSQRIKLCKEQKMEIE